MSEARIGELEDQIHQEEKHFLMEKYASLLLDRLGSANQEDGDEPLDGRAVESLQVARPIVSEPLAEKIAEFLSAQGHELEGLEDEEEGGAETTSTDTEGNEAEYGGLFDDNGEEEAEGEEEEPSEENEDAGVLFGNDIYSGNDGSGRPEEDAPDGEDALDDEDSLDPEENPGFTPSEGHDVEETPGFEPTEGHDAEQDSPGFKPTKGHEV